MRLKFIGSILALVAGLNVLAWAFTTAPAKTYPTALDFGSGIVRMGASVEPALPGVAPATTTIR